MQQKQADWEQEKVELKSQVMEMTVKLEHVEQALQNEIQEKLVLGRHLKTLRGEELSRNARHELRNRQNNLTTQCSTGVPKNRALAAIQGECVQEMRLDLRNEINRSTTQKQAGVRPTSHDGALCSHIWR